MFSFIRTQHLIKSEAVDFCLNIVMPTNVSYYIKNYFTLERRFSQRK